jgi:hypothetical protein
MIAAFAVATPAATASAAIGPTVRTAPVPTRAGNGWLSIACPPWYGFRNAANGCEPWSLYFTPTLWRPYGQ